MRIQVEIDDELLRKALEASGCSTADAVIAESFRLLIAASERRKLEDLLDMLPPVIKHPSRH